VTRKGNFGVDKLKKIIIFTLIIFFFLQIKIVTNDTTLADNKFINLP